MKKMLSIIVSIVLILSGCGQSPQPMGLEVEEFTSIEVTSQTSESSETSLSETTQIFETSSETFTTGSLETSSVVFSEILTTVETTITTKSEPTVKVGDVIEFGHSYAPYWIVLDIQDDKALIIKKNGSMSGNNLSPTPSEKPITWADSDIRKRLNDDFINSDVYSEEEKARVLLTTVKTPPNSWYDTDGGSDTEDYLFLLSVEEVVKYFGDSGDLTNCIRSDLGYDDNDNYIGFVHTDDGYLIADEYNENRVAYEGVSVIPRSWWLRSPGDSPNTLIFIDTEGSIYMCGDRYGEGWYGLRPAMWIRID